MKAKVRTWVNNVENGYISNRTEYILSEIYKKTVAIKTDLFAAGSGRVSTDELRESLKIPHQTLTAVLSQLQDEGLIYVAGEKEKGSECYSYWSYTFGNTKRLRLIDERKKEKFNAWIKRGLIEFNEYLSPQTLDELNNSLR
jgi:DNA-binding transcriptional ArsR family regulator